MIVTVPTYNRTVSLRKALLPLCSTDAEIRVFDASSVGVCNDNKEMLRTLERDYNRKIRYSSRRETDLYAKELSKHVDPKLVSFALNGNVGAIRNRILLDTLGETVLMVDDDVVPDLRLYGSYDHVTIRAPAAGLKISVDKYANCRDFDAAKKKFYDLPKGSELCRINDHLGKKIRVSGVGDATKRGLVLATQVGSVGKSPGTSWIGADTAGGAHSGAGQGIPWIRGPGNLILQPTREIKTFFLGLDNRLPLPPFLPSECPKGGIWGESVYSSILPLSVPNLYTAHLPEVILHSSAGKVIRSDEVVVPAYFILSEICHNLTSISELSASLIDIVDIDLWAAEMYVRFEDRVRSNLSKTLEALQSDVLFPRIVEASVQMEFLSNVIVESIIYYGKLLAAWDEIKEAARFIRSNGVRSTVLL